MKSTIDGELSELGDGVRLRPIRSTRDTICGHSSGERSLPTSTAVPSSNRQRAYSRRQIHHLVSRMASSALQAFQTEELECYSDRVNGAEMGVSPVSRRMGRSSWNEIDARSDRATAVNTPPSIRVRARREERSKTTGEFRSKRISRRGEEDYEENETEFDSECDERVATQDLDSQATDRDQTSSVPQVQCVGFQ